MKERKEIEQPVAAAFARFNEEFDASLRSETRLLQTAIDRILNATGKHVRPLLALLAAEACGGVKDSTVNSAIFLELLHTATLIHDDVIDETKQRRGVPSLNAIFDNRVSVLVGDYWLVKAMGLILSADNHGDRVLHIFSRTLSDLAEGEMFQLQKAETCDTDEEDYGRIIFNKTASLFEAAAVSAAISVNASQEQEQAVRIYAVSLGMAFQIRDDIFDYSPSSSQVGKPVGVDILEQKMTRPLLGALRNAGADEGADIRQKVRDIRSNPGYRDEIMAFVRTHRGIEYATKRLGEYIDKAVKALEVLPDSREKDFLAEIADYVGKRLT